MRWLSDSLTLWTNTQAVSLKHEHLIIRPCLRSSSIPYWVLPCCLSAPWVVTNLRRAGLFGPRPRYQLPSSPRMVFWWLIVPFTSASGTASTLARNARAESSSGTTPLMSLSRHRFATQAGIYISPTSFFAGGWIRTFSDGSERGREDLVRHSWVAKLNPSPSRAFSHDFPRAQAVVTLFLPYKGLPPPHGACLPTSLTLQP